VQQPTTVSSCARYAGAPGREVLEITVQAADPNRNRYDHDAPGSVGARIQATTIARWRERRGGDEFVVTNPVTGRSHHVSLAPYADLDPETTYIGFVFHFYPAPFRSKEARRIRERAILELRGIYESAIDWHTGALWEREAREGIPPEERISRDEYPRMVEYCRTRSWAYFSFATSTGILRPDEAWAILREYAARYPDLFHAW
jgi:hypothetical protein